MQLSRFYHSVKVEENKFAIFNSLIMDTFYITQNEKEEIEKCSSYNKELFKAGIYIDMPEKDQMLLEKVRNIYTEQNKKISVLYIITSTACNLACKYCFEEKSMFNNKSEVHLNSKCLHRFLNEYIMYAKENDIKKCKIIFYGGEPTINWSTIEETIKFSKKYPNFFEFTIVSNGTLLDIQKIKYLVKNDVAIAISIDGPKVLNDKNRIFRYSKESVYDKIMKTLDFLKKEKANYNLSITISNELLNMQTEFFKWVDSIETKNLFFNIMHFTYLERKEVWEIYYKKASSFLFKSFEKFYPKNIFEGRILKKITPLINKEFLFADCAAVGLNQLTLKPNGDVCICHGYVKTNKFVIGNIYRESIQEIISKKENNLWCKLSPIFNNTCLDCESLFICGGGCPVQSEALFGNVEKIDQPYCIYNKLVLKWLLRRFG